MRSVAHSARGDPALIPHHFGSKRELFLAAHQIPRGPLLLVRDAIAAEPNERGEMLARTFLHRFLKDPRGTGVSLIRAAAADESAAELLREQGRQRSTAKRNADHITAWRHSDDEHPATRPEARTI